MLVTLWGMVMEVRPEQPLNASSPMLVTPSGMVMEVRLEHSPNAHPPMLVTLLGMVVFMQPAIRVLVLVSIIALQLSLESYVLLPASTLIEVRLEQP